MWTKQQLVEKQRGRYQLITSMQHRGILNQARPNRLEARSKATFRHANTS